MILLLIILPPRVPALAAPEEPDLRLVCGAELAQPPEGHVVPALRAGDLDGGKGGDPCLILDDGDHPLPPCLRPLHGIIGVEIPEEAALSALELAARRDQKAPALGAEHPLRSLSPGGLTLGMGAPATGNPGADLRAFSDGGPEG